MVNHSNKPVRVRLAIIGSKQRTKFYLALNHERPKKLGLNN